MVVPISVLVLFMRGIQLDSLGSIHHRDIVTCQALNDLFRLGLHILAGIDKKIRLIDFNHIRRRGLIGSGFLRQGAEAG